MQWLTAAGYYQLSGYWYPFREANPSDRQRPLDTFSTGTSFAEVARLYEFDRHLKSKVHSGVERIEVAMRSQLGHLLGEIDPMAHENPANFRPGFDIPDGSKPLVVESPGVEGATHSSIITSPNTVDTYPSGY
ncbi:Abi family protein [Williamsia sp. 1135]|jgi:abortive infection bacteriophage resistance protein|uniref:Abi family protein n=1 Tax=Williamsia sp. 1135 TaxID=1889262 RepID=UPI00143B3029|nr:Abi family protein [Williamsia sp. 1135]